MLPEMVEIPLRQNDGSGSRTGVRSMHAFTASQANGINGLPSRYGGYLQASYRALKAARTVQRRFKTQREVDANA